MRVCFNEGEFKESLSKGDFPRLRSVYLNVLKEEHFWDR